MAQERIQKIIAQAGIASRRAAEQLIVDGRVRLNGQIIRVLGSKADPQQDRIEIEGLGTISREAPVYIMMCKPRCVISTVNDPEGRDTVIDILRQSRALGDRKFEGDLPRVYPVGRLDFDAEGLILLTNDGDWAHQLTHPRYHVPRTYAVKVRGKPDAKDIARLRAGLWLPGEIGKPGCKSLPAEVDISRAGPRNTWMEVTVFEGKNHLIKRMFFAIGSRVQRLVRIDYGGLQLGNLPEGAWRFLSTPEVASLHRWSKGNALHAEQSRRTKRRHG